MICLAKLWLPVAENPQIRIYGSVSGQNPAPSDLYEVLITQGGMFVISVQPCIGGSVEGVSRIGVSGGNLLS